MTVKILLVDDMKTVLMLEKMMLSAEGYQFDTASDGLEALKRIEASTPDLILMDMMMPNLDGIETCRRIKGNPETKEIPVIMVTTKGEDSNIEAAFMAGCDDYLTKPIDKTLLISKMKALLA